MISLDPEIPLFDPEPEALPEPPALRAWSRRDRRYAGGRRPSPAVEPLPEAERERRDLPREAAPEYRILAPAAGQRVVEATPGQTPAGAAALAAAARSAGRRVLVTYSLAEEVATGRLVAAVAVRVAGMGYALWRNGTYDSGHMLAHRVNATEATALVKGEEYIPPAPKVAALRGACLRCGKEVSYRSSGFDLVPYKHNRPDAGEGQRGAVTTC